MADTNKVILSLGLRLNYRMDKLMLKSLWELFSKICQEWKEALVIHVKTTQSALKTTKIQQL